MSETKIDDACSWYGWISAALFCSPLGIYAICGSVYLIKDGDDAIDIFVAIFFFAVGGLLLIPVVQVVRSGLVTFVNVKMSVTDEDICNWSFKAFGVLFSAVMGCLMITSGIKIAKDGKWFIIIAIYPIAFGVLLLIIPLLFIVYMLSGCWETASLLFKKIKVIPEENDPMISARTVKYVELGQIEINVESKNTHSSPPESHPQHHCPSSTP